ncbi:hypothetical protein SDJN03_06971, partial [Cucurbita argyrosperma subsp. sororia]
MNIDYLTPSSSLLVSLTIKVRCVNGTERKTAGEYGSTLYAGLVDNIRGLSILAIDDDQETGDMNGWVMVELDKELMKNHQASLQGSLILLLSCPPLRRNQVLPQMSTPPHTSPP